MEFVSNVFTNKHCIGCNKCVYTCPAVGANVYKASEEGARIEVDRGGCIECGQCFDVCDHDARSFIDDTERFMADLKTGEKISLLVAPSFKISYPDDYRRLLGVLRSMGVDRIVSVAFGADLCTWAYLQYLEGTAAGGGAELPAGTSPRGKISTPCPAFVSYVEHYEPALIPYMIPVKSPVLCAATYMRKEMGMTEKFAFLGPCIAKRTEFLEAENAGLVEYNLTYSELIPELRRIAAEPDSNFAGQDGGFADEEMDDIMGRFYPVPGGLGENVRWYQGRGVRIRDVSGKENLYRWLTNNRSRLLNEETPYYMIDVLNCMDGCLEGTAVENHQNIDDAINVSEDMRDEKLSQEDSEAYREHREHLEAQFAGLNLTDYLRRFQDRSYQVKHREPTDAEAESIYQQMHKTTPLSRRINCAYCGYNTCADMVRAVYNGYSDVDNCIHYEKDEALLQLEQAQKASAAKTTFLANMSHDIRTPMNAVIGFAELAQTEGKNKEEVMDYLRQIDTSGKQLLDIINNILELTKIEHNKISVEEVLTDVEKFYEDLMTVFKADAAAREIQLTMDTKRVHQYLYIDRTMKEQIILNIVGNALKYTPKHGSVHVSFEELPYSGAAEGDEWCVIRTVVEDTGIGMSDEFQENLFKTFERERNSTISGIQGTGLGLAIVKELVELMNGSISVESQSGQGTRVIIDVPHRIGSAPSSNHDEDQAADIAEKLEGRRVLLAEDIDVNAMLATQILEMNGLLVERACDGVECLGMVQEHGADYYDLVLMDIQMPKMNGYDAAKAIRGLTDDHGNADERSGIPILAMTANAFAEDRQAAMDAGMNGHIAKPIDIDKLLETMVAVIS